ncbi:cytochrome c3 family protein [Sulfurimonas sp.]|uniref:cytochrome c3 family protein n=1 Tax=Sulfurimonas sp. TaxID=2022749 RepID=UPI00261E9B30|nr:cytochrome c3 family protein [Sulfurimonas sp.]MDD5156655.1 cytochrome c3 family protein [Sulfurimonas sp.]
MKLLSTRKRLVPLTFFSLFYLTSLTLSATTLEIIRPLAKTVIDESEITIVVKVTDPQISRVVFTDAQGNQFEREIKANKQVYCQSLKANLGDNPLSVVSYKEKEVKESKTISVYFRSEISPGFQDEPSGFKKNLLHNDKNEQLCKTCHVMSDKPRKKGEIVENPEDSSCYQCHKNLVSQTKGHAPALNWMCTECHTGEKGEYSNAKEDKSKYTTPDPIMDRCFGCHENIKNVWFAKKSEHGPVRDGRCNRCHNPHGSNQEFFLRKSIWDLCTTCHSEKATGAHVISSFVRGSTHPTKGVQDPARPGRELVCSGCHDPHGSEGIFLLRSKGKTAFSVCVRCHKK